jgi:hypothetical protein
MSFYLRLGMTESTLMFYYWLLYKKKISNQRFAERVESNNQLINWLYTTSGFYDKNILGTYFDFDAKKCSDSLNYKRYMEHLFECVLISEIQPCFHYIPDALIPMLVEFKGVLQKNSRRFYFQDMLTTDLFSRINGKKILIVNPMSALMKQQYDCGNVQNIHTNFPIFQSLEILENPYTFFNNGPDSSVFETAEKVFAEIQLKEFDIAIVSCGAYSSIIGKYIMKKMRKDVITIGGNLLSIFGIKIGRNKNFTFNQYWISVPDHLKPKDYMKIEDGCYW